MKRVFVVVFFLFPFCFSFSNAQPSPRALGDWWDANHVQLPLPPLIQHADVEARLKSVAASDPAFFTLETLGTSVENRAIYHLSFGRGPRAILLWSQMHGDEPTATRALFDVIAYFHSNRQRDDVRQILESLTIHLVPMLNPDGAAKFQRRNAQGIDINRDALMLQTPEGKLLKNLRDDLNPELGFNLHNQSWRTSVANTNKPASISLLAVAFDEERSDNPGRVLAKKVASLVREAVEVYAPGQVAKYDDSFEPRAFGDNLTKWGTPVVLIETGAYQGHEPDRHLVRINFVAILTALDALGSRRTDAASTDGYESLPLNGSSTLYQIISGALVVPGNGVPAFKADIGLTATRTVRDTKEGPQVILLKRIEEFGDLRVFGALETIAADGMTAAPVWDARLKLGDVVQLPDFASKKAPFTIGPSQPANFVLLKPVGEGRYRVDRFFWPEETMR